MRGFNLQECSPEELALLEQTFSQRPDGERDHADLLTHISILIITQAMRTGETLDIHPECHIPQQRIPSDIRGAYAV